MTTAVASLFNALNDAGSLSRECLAGCTADEIAVVRSHFSHELPLAYEEFLRLAGKGAGRLFCGSEIYYPKLLGLQNAAKELLIENGETLSLPDEAIVFYMHQGYELCFLIPNTEDPPVFQYVEGQPGFSNPWGKFSEFLKDSIAEHLKEWPNLSQ